MSVRAIGAAVAVAYLVARVQPVVVGQSGGVVEDRYRPGRTYQILGGQRLVERHGEGNE